jgi:hypothetical protein
MAGIRKEENPSQRLAREGFSSLMVASSCPEDMLPPFIAEFGKGWYNRHLFQQRTPSLFRPFFKTVSFTKASWICFRLFCPRGKRGGMSGGHFESFTAVNIHEVQNTNVSLLSFLRKNKSVPIRNESHNCWLFRCHFSQYPCFLKYFELTVSTEHYCMVRDLIVPAQKHVSLRI